MKKKKSDIKKVVRSTTIRINGEFVSSGVDGNGNPRFNFLSVKYCTPEAFQTEVKRLKKQYGEVEQVDGHKIVKTFYETINDGNRAKEVTQDLKQYLYTAENGWKEMNPSTEGEHVEIKGAEQKNVDWKAYAKIGLYLAAGMALAYTISFVAAW